MSCANRPTSDQSQIQMLPARNSAQTAPAAGSDVEPLQTTTHDYKFSNASDDQTAQINADFATKTTPPIVASDRFAELSPQQKAAIEMLVQGKVDRVVAETVGAHRVTITKWRLYHAGFRAELARRRDEVWGSLADRYRSSLDAALDVVLSDLTGSDKNAAFRAAKNLLGMAKKFAPPDEPIDPVQVIEHHARLLKRAMRSLDPMVEQVDEEDFEIARRDLLHKLNGPLPQEQKS